MRVDITFWSLVEGCERMNEQELIRSISVIIPCYNEQNTIERVILGLQDALPGVEIVIVDDGSTDGSLSAVASLSNIIIVKHFKNFGQGLSLVHGMKKATRPFVLWFDADGQHLPTEAVKLVRLIPDFDCVIGVRDRTSMAMKRGLVARNALHLLVWAIVGVRVPDLNSGMRIFRKDVICKYYHLIPERFSASSVTTLIMLERKCRVAWTTVQIECRDGKSTLSPLLDGFQAMRLVTGILVAFRPSRVFVPIAASFIISGMIYGVLRAFRDGRGFPDLAVLIVLSGVQMFLFGILAEQLSLIRKEKYE